MQILKKAHNKKYNCIFFDIFDTIVERTVEPEYTKKMWANYIVKRFDLNISITELYDIRSHLELKLGEKSATQGNDWEFSYNDLIKEIHNKLQLTIEFKEFLKIAEETEIIIEKNVQKVDEEIVKEINKLKKEGKKVYCVSDMYLSKKMIEDIFEEHNIKSLFDDIYISCEFHKNKKSGKLYDIVLKSLNEKAENCIMIGDNRSSDYDMPLSKNIDAIHLDRTENYKKHREFGEKYSQSSIEKRFSNISQLSTDNFENSIFSLYTFTEKLYYNLLKENKEEVFFLSREGEYLKKLFDAYVEKINYKKIKSHYLLVSRKATYLPSLESIDKEDFGRLLKQYTYISINEFLKSLNLEEEEIKKIQNSYIKDCKKYKGKLNLNEKKEIEGIKEGNFDTKVIYLYNSKLLEILKKNKTFKDIYELKRKEQKKLFKQYIKSITNDKKICVVDIGWNGSIQDNIQYILGDDYEITGYLYGLICRDRESFQNNKKGLIFSNFPTETKNFSLFTQNRTIFEILLGASHGSANKYVLEDKKVIVSLFSKEEERNLYRNVVSKIQNAMFKRFEELLEILPNGFYDNKLIERKINRIHFNMVFLPTKEQLTFFNKISHYENFGVFEFSKFSLKQKLNMKYYIKENIKFFVRNKSFFYDTFWPVLKLYNEKLHIQKFFYVNVEKIKLIMGRLI